MARESKAQEIARILAGEIRSGGREPGDRLPSESELSQRFHVARMTARRALMQLRADGMAIAHIGQGTFVAGPRTIRRLDPRDRLSRARRSRDQAAFRAEATEQGWRPESRTVIWFEPAADYAELLGIGERDEVCVRDRVMSADAVPVMLATSRFPREISRGSAIEEENTGPGGVHARIEELGYPLTSFEALYSAKIPSRSECLALRVSAQSALLIERRIAYSGERAVEINDQLMPAHIWEVRHSWDAE